MVPSAPVAHAATWSAPQPLVAEAGVGVGAAGAADRDGHQLFAVRTGRAGAPLQTLGRAAAGAITRRPLQGTTARSVEPSVSVSTATRLIAWRDDSPRSYTAIRAVLADGGDPFGAPLTIAGPEAGGVRHPAAAIDAAGWAVVAFNAQTNQVHLNQRGRVAIAVRTPGGTFSPGRLVTPAPAAAPVVAIGNGRSVVAWVRRGQVEAASVEQGVVGRPKSLGPARGGDVSVAVGARGRAVIAWTDRSRAAGGGTQHRLLVATRSHNGTFRAARVVRQSSSRVLQRPAVAVQSDGRVLIAWSEEDYNGTSQRRGRGFNGVYARVDLALGTTGTGRFGAPRAVSPAEGYTSSPSVAALNATAAFAVAWNFRLDDADSGVTALLVGPGEPEVAERIGAPLVRPVDVFRVPQALNAGTGASVVWVADEARTLLVSDGRRGP